MRVIRDTDIRIFPATHKIVSRVREFEGIRTRYVVIDPSNPRGQNVEPTLEEAYLTLREPLEERLS
jgi:hypothetical protein